MGQIEKHKCCGQVYVPQSFHSFRPCDKSAKIERNGKWYCGLHDPEAKKARRAANDAKYSEKSKKNHAAWVLQCAAPDLLAACKLSQSTMRRQFVEGNAPDSWGDDEHAAFTALSAAIARAEGTK